MKHTTGKTLNKTTAERLRAFVGALALSATTLFSATAQAAQIPISDLPLFLGVSVRPNVFFQNDDSGSMDWEVSVSPYWHACAYDSNAPLRNGNDDCEGLQDDEGTFNGFNGGGYVRFRSMFDTPDAWNQIVENSQADVLAADWRPFSHNFNKVYFNPAVTYEPWPGEVDQPFNNAANTTGHASGADNRDLAGFTFAIWKDDRGYDGGRPHRGDATGARFQAGTSGATFNSASNSAFVHGTNGAVLTTVPIDASGGSAGTVSVWARRGDNGFSNYPELGDDAVIEYRSSGGDWVSLQRLAGGGTAGEQFNLSLTLPADAFHAGLQIRLRVTGGSGAGFDFWHFDDIDVTVDGASVFSDDFESGLAVADWGDTAVNATATPNGEVDLWDSHLLVTVNNTDVTLTEVSYSPDATGLNRTATSQTVGSGAVASKLGVSLADLQQNIANWYAYGRRRSFVAAAAIGAVLQQNPNFRYGLNTINNNTFTEVPTATSGDFTAHNDALYADVKANHPNGGTPLRTALERVGEYYSDNLSFGGNDLDDPIVHECQKNFSVLLSDGFWNSNNAPGVNDVDGDGFDSTLADVARHYYETDLSPLPNEVPPDPADPAEYQHMVTFPVAFGLEGLLKDTDGDGWPNPPLVESDVWGGQPVRNTATTIDDMWHAAYNSKGEFVSAQTPQALVDALLDALATVAERDSSAAAVAVNSGSFQTGSALFQARFNSNDWSGDLLAFGLQEVTSPQDPSLKLVFPEDTPTWRASDQIADEGPGTREIATFKPSTGEGIPFDWPANPASPTVDELDVAQSSALDLDPDSGAVDGLGEVRVDYLRGDQSLEVSNGGNFRTRSSILGDLVSSAPVFVGDPSFLYPETWPGASPPETSYSEFIADNLDRQPMVYVGGNDGIFHAFDASSGEATSGEEVFGYVPAAIYDNLNRLTSQNYTHQFYVDGSPTYADVFFGGAWHSVVASGLRKGGQAVFALDVTDPDPAVMNENNAGSIVLWEFGDEPVDRDGDGDLEGDADLGYSFAQPSLVRLQNGRWGAIFGNGYNNTEADGSASATGNAVLYIVDVETGEIIRKLDTGYGTADDPEGNSRPNGLATPAVIDINGDLVADLVYAGDIFGNLWKFDISDTNPTNWDSFVQQGGNPRPMFTTESPTDGEPQPITVRPQVGFHPAGLDGLMVYFGTGKYIGSDDNTQVGQDTQSFYAVWDRVGNSGQNIFDRSMLLEQTIDEEVTLTQQSAFFTNPDGTAADTTAELRVTSDNDITDWFDGQGGSVGEFAGWYIDLVDPDDNLNHGEKAVTNPRLRGDRIIFTTLIPSESPCAFGGDSWLMELATIDGGRLSEPPFDLNDDAGFGAADMTSSGQVPSGIKSQKGIFSEATILQVPTGEVKLMSSSSGEVSAIQENAGDEDSGRQSWEELR